MHSVAVLTFPGNNCEQETVRAIRSVGLCSEVFLWNRTSQDLFGYDAVVIPGGFSFEDRGRSGVVSACEPIFETLKQMAKNGTPILGICNGAQMLVESGLIFEDTEGFPAVGLLRNKRVDSEGMILGTGFYHSWRTLVPVNTCTPFSFFDDLIHVPLAHGEGRFTLSKEMEEYCLKNNRIVFQYATESGEVLSHYPTNPNGSFCNTAGLCNAQGNVLALMPHPERTENGAPVFRSLKKYLENPWDLPVVKDPVFSAQKEESKILPVSEVSMIVRLKITDKTEKTFQSLLNDTSLVRRERWGFSVSKESSVESILEMLAELIRSGEVVNQNKQWVVVGVDGKWFDWNEGEGFLPSTPRFDLSHCFESREKEQSKGASLVQHLSGDARYELIQSVSFGVLWECSSTVVRDKYAGRSLFVSQVGEDVFVL